MSIKKSALLLPTYASACTQYQTLAAQKSTTSCHFTSRNHSRNYATHHEIPQPPLGGNTSPRTPPKEDTDSPWPTAKPPRTTPTPYEILQLKPQAPYTKKTARFYELVKIYHPDRHDHPSTKDHSSIPAQIRLDRYRLVVSAHVLLSDPSKRRAYDLYGAGWTGAKSAFQTPDFTMSPEARDACMHNATWQDWENWYDRFNPPKPGEPPRKPQAPVFLSNTAFISIVGIMAALAGVGQATRMQSSSKEYIFMVDEASNRAKGEMVRLQETKDGWTREQRIDHFVKDREVYVEERVRRYGEPEEAEPEPGEMVREEDLTRNYR